MILAPALSIEGWMREPELYWLAREAELHKNIIEVGVFKGRTTRVLADNTNGIVHAIDPWDNSLYKNGSTDEAANKILKNIMTEFYLNLSDHINRGKVKIYKRKFTNCQILSPDMIFIDAIHEYENVKDDIQHALKLLNGKGLISGHDYHSSWPGVIQAVTEYFGQKVQICDTIWHYRL